MTTLGLDGTSVQSIASDYTVRVQLTAGHIIVIESPFTLRLGTNTTTLSPEEDPERTSEVVQQLVGHTVEAATVDEAGALRVSFDRDVHLLVEPDPAYEAWSLSSPDGALVVSTPGGKLAIWSAQKGAGETP